MQAPVHREAHVHFAAFQRFHFLFDVAIGKSFKGKFLVFQSGPGEPQIPGDGADQFTGFGVMAAEGQVVAQIGAQKRNDVSDLDNG